MGDEQLAAPQRRTFLVILLGGVGAVITAMTAWPVWKYLAPGKKDGVLEKIAVKRSDVPVGQAHFFDFHGRPAVVLQTAVGEFAAFLAVCTHLGCVVKWIGEKQEFFCPCHAGRYSPSGTVLGGPPPKPLEALGVTVHDDQVLVG